MVAIDSYKMSFDIGIIKDVDFSKFDRQINLSGTTAEDELLHVDKAKQDKFFCMNPGLGINRIEVNETTNKVILQGSAKVLRDQSEYLGKGHPGIQRYWINQVRSC